MCFKGLIYKPFINIEVAYILPLSVRFPSIQTPRAKWVAAIIRDCQLHCHFDTSIKRLRKLERLAPLSASNMYILGANDSIKDTDIPLDVAGCITAACTCLRLTVCCVSPIVSKRCLSDCSAFFALLRFSAGGRRPLVPSGRCSVFSAYFANLWFGTCCRNPLVPSGQCSGLATYCAGLRLDTCSRLPIMDCKESDSQHGKNGKNCNNYNCCLFVRLRRGPFGCTFS